MVEAQVRGREVCTCGAGIGLWGLDATRHMPHHHLARFRWSLKMGTQIDLKPLSVLHRICGSATPRHPLWGRYVVDARTAFQNASPPQREYNAPPALAMSVWKRISCSSRHTTALGDDRVHQAGWPGVG